MEEVKDEKPETVLCAVYGSLRKEMGNHPLIAEGEFLGETKTEAKYTLFSLAGGGFPGIHEDGKTAITIEVYRITPEVDKRIESLEGYTPGGSFNMYEKKTVETEFGEASIYIFNGKNSNKIIESGDWKSFKTGKEEILVKPVKKERKRGYRKYKKDVDFSEF